MTVALIYLINMSLEICSCNSDSVLLVFYDRTKQNIQNLQKIDDYFVIELMKFTTVFEYIDRQAIPDVDWTSGGLLQDGPDDIALYRAPAGAFPYQTDPTSNGLIDALVYSTAEGDSHSLIDALMPGKLVRQGSK